MRWTALGALGALGCVHVMRVSEGFVLGGLRRPGAELAVTAAHFVSHDDRGGTAIGLRAAAMVDREGVSAVIGLSIEHQQQPPRRITGYAEDTEPSYAPPRGTEWRVGAHAGNSAGGEVAVLRSHGLDGLWNDAPVTKRHRYQAIGVELGGEWAVSPIGPEPYWAAVRLVEERDLLVVPRIVPPLVAE